MHYCIVSVCVLNSKSRLSVREIFSPVKCVLSLCVVLCVLIAFSLVWERRVRCRTLLCALSRYILPARPEAWVKLTFTKVQGSWKVNGAKRTVKVRCVSSLLTRFRLIKKNEGKQLKVDSSCLNKYLKLLNHICLLHVKISCD